MGYKKVCLECKMTFNRPFNDGLGLTYPCPKCGKSMKLLPHTFRPPKKTDNKKWETVKYLIENGFYYQHIWQKNETENGVTSYENYVKYPDSIRDAKEFVEKYKEQAQK